MNRQMQFFLRKPEVLCFIDAVGALLTAIFLYVILRNFQQVGMLIQVFDYLILAALLLFFFSGANFLLVKKRYKYYFGIVGVANLIYCIVTACLVYSYFDQLAILSKWYFILEIIIVCMLAYVELGVSFKMINQSDYTADKAT